MEEKEIKKIIGDLYNSYDYHKIYTVLNYYKDKKELNCEIVNTLLKISLNKKVFPKRDDYQMMKYLFVQIKKNNIKFNKEVYDIFLNSNWAKDIKMGNLFLNEMEYINNESFLMSKPSLGEFVLTTKCNLECAMCNYVNERKLELEDKIIDNIEQMLKYLICVTWCGGEVVLFKRFSELVEVAKMYDVEQNIITNGLSWKNKIFKAINNCRVNISVSIDGFNKQEYFYTRQIDAFDKVKDFMKDLNKYKTEKMKININTIIMKHNLEKVNEILDFCKQYSIDRVTLIPLKNLRKTFFDKENIFNNLDTIYADIDRLKIGLDKMNIELCVEDSQNFYRQKKKIQQNTIIENNNTIENNIQERCWFPWKHIGISVDGNVSFSTKCEYEDLIIGNAKENSIMEIWNSQKAQDIRKNIIQNTNFKGCLKIPCYGINY